MRFRLSSRLCRHGQADPGFPACGGIVPAAVRPR